MSTPAHVHHHKSVQTLLDETPLRVLLGIADEVLDRIRATAFDLYEARRYADAEVLCRGLVAADHTDSWSCEMLAATLRCQGRSRDALAEVQTGLGYAPRAPKLLHLRDELNAAIARDDDIAASHTPPKPTIAV